MKLPGNYLYLLQKQFHNRYYPVLKNPSLGIPRYQCQI